MTKCIDCEETNYLKNPNDVRCAKHKKMNTVKRKYKRRHIHRLKCAGLR